MAIKLAGAVETLEGVPEAYHDRYEQKGEQFFLKEIEFDDPAEVKGKLSKKEKLLTEANSKLARYGKLQELSDDDLEDLLTLREAKAAGSEGNGKEGKPADPDLLAKWQQEREAALKKQEAKFKSELEAKDKAISEMDSKFKSFVTKTTLTTLALKAGVIPDRVDSWLKTHADRFQLDADGNLIPLDDDGDPSDVKAEKFIAEKLKEATPWFYAAVEQGGSGSGGSNGKASPSFGLKRSAMTSEQKAEYIRKYSMDAYLKLPDK